MGPYASSAARGAPHHPLHIYGFKTGSPLHLTSHLSKTSLATRPRIPHDAAMPGRRPPLTLASAVR